MRVRRNKHEAGMVLIAVLWGIVVLASTALALSTMVRLGSETLRMRKEQLQAYYLARGALFRTVAVLNPLPSSSHQQQIFQLGQRSLEWKDDLAKVTVEIQSENGKIDINRATEEVLNNLFQALGLDMMAAQALTACVEDWRDADSVPRINGAEDDYYLSLPHPYHAANADFRSIEELLLVKGVTPELFWGRYVVGDDGKVERQPGLVDCLTVGLDGGTTINMNYAPWPVLMAIPGMRPEIADYIVQGRQQKPFTSLSDLSERFPASLGAETASFLTTGTGDRYSLVGIGVMPSGVRARVRAVVRVPGAHGALFQILVWDDNYVD